MMVMMVLMTNTMKMMVMIVMMILMMVTMMKIMVMVVMNCGHEDPHNGHVIGYGGQGDSYDMHVDIYISFSPL